MSRTIITEAEGFELRVVTDDQTGAAAGVRTVPSGAQFPLLARLHGYSEYDPASPPDVGEVLDPGVVAPGLTPAQQLDAFAERVLEISASNDLVTRVVERTPTAIRFELRDARAVELEGAMDLSQQAAVAGLPLAATLLADGRIVGPATERGHSLARLDEGQNQGDAQSRAAAAIQALREAFPDPDSTYFSLADFLAKRGHETPWNFGRALYKYTDCGPWTSFVVPGFGKRGQVYYEDKTAAEQGAAWWPQCVGLQIGSIVEGSDAEVQPETLLWPFTDAQLDRTVENINSEASMLWDEANLPDGGDEDEEGDRSEAAPAP